MKYKRASIYSAIISIESAIGDLEKNKDEFKDEIEALESVNRKIYEKDKIEMERNIKVASWQEYAQKVW